MTVNDQKTKHRITCPPGRKCCSPNVPLNSEKLDIVHKFKYLGVIVDDDLNLNSFLSEKCNKVNARIYRMSRLCKYITSKIACLIYKQIILPICEYADQRLLVELGPSEKVSRLQSLQDKAVRIIDNNEHRGVGTEGLNNLFRMDLLKLRRPEHLACSMYRLSTNASRVETGRPRVHLRSRNKIKFKIQKRTYEKYLKSPLSRGITL